MEKPTRKKKMQELPSFSCLFPPDFWAVFKKRRRGRPVVLRPFTDTCVNLSRKHCMMGTTCILYHLTNVFLNPRGNLDFQARLQFPIDKKKKQMCTWHECSENTFGLCQFSDKFQVLLFQVFDSLVVVLTQTLGRTVGFDRHFDLSQEEQRLTVAVVPLQTNHELTSDA